MKLRTVVESDSFAGECSQIFKGSKEADEILRGTQTLLSAIPDKYPKIPQTDIYYIMASDFPRDRFVVIYYTIQKDTVMMLSIRTFKV